MANGDDLRTVYPKREHADRNECEHATRMTPDDYSKNVNGGDACDQNDD